MPRTSARIHNLNLAPGDVGDDIVDCALSLAEGLNAVALRAAEVVIPEPLLQLQGLLYIGA